MGNVLNTDGLICFPIFHRGVKKAPALVSFYRGLAEIDESNTYEEYGTHWQMVNVRLTYRLSSTAFHEFRLRMLAKECPNPSTRASGFGDRT